jgi:vacuolar-type H+-ATPase subunit H
MYKIPSAPEEDDFFKQEVDKAPEPNRKQRRSFHSIAKKRVKQIIKKQDQRNAKYRAQVKSSSSGDVGAPGVGEVDIRKDYL